MQFGLVPEDTLNKINFSLPKEPAFNDFTTMSDKEQNAKVYTGCNMWGQKEWVGKIYPAATKEKDFLTHYSKQYNSVELNATHYKIYHPSVLKSWSEKVQNNNFIFCTKMFKGITHDGSLLNKQILTTQFLNSVVALEQNLGPIFIQLSDSFSPKRKDELFYYLNTLPKEFQFFVEVRHADWFMQTTIQTELFSFLKNNNIGAIITDTAGKRACAHMHLTIPKTFIRFVGNSLHPTDYTRIDILGRTHKKMVR